MLAQQLKALALAGLDFSLEITGFEMESQQRTENS